MPLLRILFVLLPAVLVATMGALAAEPANNVDRASQPRVIPAVEVDDSPLPDWIDEFLTTIEVSTHGRKARAWLDQHPHHSESLYVAERLYLVARLQPDAELWDWTREYIEAHHPQAIFADFVATDFVNGTVDGVNRALAGYLERRLFPKVLSQQPSAATFSEAAGNRFQPERIVPVLRVVAAAARRQPDALTALPDDMAFRLHLALVISPNAVLEAALRPKLEKLSAEGRDVANLLLQEGRPSAERLTELERLRRPGTTNAVALYQEYLWHGLSADERGRREVLAIEAERQIEAQQHAAALKSLTRLQSLDPNTRTEYLLGWSQQSLGRFDDAIAHYRSIAEPASNDPWRRMAAEAVAYSADQNQRKQEFAASLYRFLDQFRGESLPSFYVRYRSLQDERPRLRLFAFIDSSRGRMHAVASQGDRLSFAGEGGTSDHWLLFGDESIRVHQKVGGTFPRFNVTIPIRASAGAEWRFNFNTCPDPAQFGRDLRDCLNQPSLVSAEALHATVSRFVGAGFLQREAGAEEAAKWVCHTPEIRTAQWEKRRWTISRDATLLKWEGDPVEFEIGLAEHPDFPELNELKKLPERGSVPGSEGREVRAFGLVMSLFTDLMSNVKQPLASALVEGESIQR